MPAAKYSARRVAVALAVGLAGAMGLWAVVPYNNILLANSFIADTFLPVSAVIFMALLVLAVNPLLGRLGPDKTLDRRQLALVFGILLIAAVLPSSGLLRMAPYSLAQSNMDINDNPRLWDIVREMDLPESLFPDTPGYGNPAPAAGQFLDELDNGADVPWSNWMRPLLSWGVFLAACWLMMVGLASIVYPHWRYNERLQFPLLAVQQTLIEEPGAGGTVPPLFRSRSFWTGCLVVMALYAMNGLNHHTGGRCPPFPLGWNLSPVFSEMPWRQMGWWVKKVEHVYFMLIGITFFMPNRIGFSVWFVMVGYAVYNMVWQAYFPPFHYGAFLDQRNGAVIALALSILFLSRKRWAEVAGLMFRGCRTDAERRDRSGGRMFLAGIVGLYAWLVWAGVGPVWAAMMVLIGFTATLVISRIVAETGMPFMRIVGFRPDYFMALLPAAWVSGAALYIGGFMNLVFTYGTRVSAAVMATHALGMDRESSPRHQQRLGYLMIAVLLIGLVVCGAVHLNMGYHHSADIAGDPIMGSYPATRLQPIQSGLEKWARGAWQGKSYSAAGHLFLGVAIALILQTACLMLPRWPLHPIGMLLVGTYYGTDGWASFLIGWALKVLILRYGGARAYRSARPLFLGVIMGEVFSAMIWTGVPLILILLGADPADVGHIRVLPL